MQQNSLSSVIADYQRKRSLAWETSAEIFGIVGLQLGPVRFQDAAVADTWSQQWPDPAKRPTWRWAEMFIHYHKMSAFKRFEVAVSLAGQLCALSYGMPSNGKLILKIHALARAPGASPLAGQVLPIVLACADSYARLLGSQEIWICNPMNEGVAKYYESFEFTPVCDRRGKTTHLIMRLQS